MPNITAPKIPEGDKVDFDVSLNYITSCIRFKVLEWNITMHSHPKASHTDAFASAYTSNTHSTL